MKTSILFLSLLIVSSSFSQSFNFMVGDRRSSSPIEDPETETFENNGNKYILYQAYSMKDGMQVQLQGYKPNNDYLCSKKLYVPEEKMLISIYEGFLNLENNMQLIKSTFNKEAKKTFVYAHAINEFGDETDDHKELLSIPAEKAMNSGNFTCATSPNRKFSVILSELPFVKETKEKILITVFDQTLKTIFSKEYEFPYEAKRGPVNKPVIADDGSVYIIKKVPVSKMPDIISVFSISYNGESFKENTVKLDDPKKYESYNFTLNNKNELVLAGFYTEDGKVTFGGTKQKGTFYLQVNSKGDLITYQISAFEKHYTDLKIRQVLCNGTDWSAMITEVYSKRNNSTIGAGNQLVYTTDINEGDAVIFVLNQKGENIRAQSFKKSQHSSDDGGLYGSVFGAFIKDKLVVVYNDFQYNQDGKKYVVVPPALVNIKIPVIQVINKSGYIENTYPMIGSPVGGMANETNLLPLTGYKLSDTALFFIGYKDDDCMPIILNIK
jgi:hypothetical protein